MLTTLALGQGAWLAATAEVGQRAFRACAATSGDAAAQAAAALRAPPEVRAGAAEDALWTTHEAQRQILHGIGGLPTLWGMAFLHQFDAARRRQRAP